MFGVSGAPASRTALFGVLLIAHVLTFIPSLEVVRFHHHRRVRARGADGGMVQVLVRARRRIAGDESAVGDELRARGVGALV